MSPARDRCRGLPAWSRHGAPGGSVTAECDLYRYHVFSRAPGSARHAERRNEEQTRYSRALEIDHELLNALTAARGHPARTCTRTPEQHGAQQREAAPHNPKVARTKNKRPNSSAIWPF
jgi:hypothetical protein